MSEHTNNVQIINKDGKPAFAVIPYDEFLALTGQKAEEQTIPHEVVGLVIKNDCSLIQAWRRHLGISQKKLALMIGVTQPALSQMERSSNKLKQTTIDKLADAMGLQPEQLVD